MEIVDSKLRKLLRGEGLPTPHVDVRVPEAESFMPITKLTVCYIVCGVLVNEKNQVLMMQEAKRSCYGLWYLPAGRVEPGENLTDAVKREVKEETGLECEPTTMIMVECGSGIWYRFSFTGRVTGGKLKTLEEKDAESLQAKWVDLDDIWNSRISLRANDIIKLIKCAQQYYSVEAEKRHAYLLPVVQDHSILMMRLVVIWNSPELKILTSTTSEPHFPVGMVAPRDRSNELCCHRVLKDVFGKVTSPPKVIGALSVEHCGIPAGEHDGLLCTIMLLYDAEEAVPDITNSAYQWTLIADDVLKSELLARINQNLLVPFSALF